MRRAFLVLVLLGALLIGYGHEVQAAAGDCTVEPWLQSMGFEQITVSNTAIGFTSGTFQPTGQQPAQMAVVSVESNPIRGRDDGPVPTAAVGQPYAASTAFTVCGVTNIQKSKFIRSGGSDATLSVTYYRPQQ